MPLDSVHITLNRTHARLGAHPTDERELAFVYEKGLKTLPSMAVVLAAPSGWTADPTTGITRSMLVQGEQEFILHSPLPVAVTGRGDTRITHVVDKGEGKGALIYLERKLVDDASGKLLATLYSTTFCRADGGFGGTAVSPRAPHPIAATAPDMMEDMPTFAHSALLYRLCSDYNSLHADPARARAGKYPRPILHGLCSYGVAAHAIIKACCDYDPARLRGVAARFSAPVFPGETISVEIWRDGDTVSFQAWVRARQAKVLDNGRALIGPAQ